MGNSTSTVAVHCKGRLQLGVANLLKISRARPLYRVIDLVAEKLLFNAYLKFCRQVGRYCTVATCSPVDKRIFPVYCQQNLFLVTLVTGRPVVDWRFSGVEKEGTNIGETRDCPKPVDAAGRGPEEEEDKEEEEEEEGL